MNNYYKKTCGVLMLCLLLTVRVLAAPPTLIAAVDLRIEGPGAQDPAFLPLTTHFPLEKNQPLSLPKYNEAKKALFDHAEKIGYPRATLETHRILIDRVNHRAYITLLFNTGPRYYFGKVSFQENPLGQDLLNRFVSFKPGEPYNATSLMTLQDNLHNSNYFQHVSVVPDFKHATDNTVPVQVKLFPRKRSQISLGGGYGTDTGIRGSAAWDWRYLTDKGDRLSTVVGLSEVKNSAQISYTFPGEHPLTDQYGVTVSAITTKYPVGEAFTQKIGIGHMKTSGFWKRTLSLNHQFEHDSLFNRNSVDYQLFFPTLAWQYLNSDDPLFPHWGHRFNLTMQGTAHPLFSNATLAQAEIQDKYILPVGSLGRFILRGDVGYTVVKEWGNKLPLSLSYFTGGAQSVRGYSYQSIGPGRYLLVGSAEYQHHITGNWYSSLFYDMGDAFNDFPHGSVIGSLNRGVGLGVVWVSPLGPLNLTLAKAISAPGRPMQIQFTMGPDL